MDKITHTIDCGRNSGVIYYVEEDRHETLTHAQILDLPCKLPMGSFVAGERAHFAVPRTKKSLAQVFTEDQLLQFYFDFEENGIKFRLSAHDNAPQARTYSQIKKVIPTKKNMDGKKIDEYDTKALAYYLNAHDRVRSCLQIPPKTFTKDRRRIDGEAMRQKLNENLNIARSEGYDPDTLPTMKLIYDNILDLYHALSPRSREVLRLKLSKNKKSITKTSVNDTTLYSIVGTIFDVDGVPMTRYDNKVPGWNFVRRYILAFSPNHRRGGVAASNIKYHGFRSFVKRETKNMKGVDFNRTFDMEVSKGNKVKAKIKRGHMTAKENEVFLSLRKDYTNMVREVWRFFANLACKDGNYQLLGENNGAISLAN